MNAITKITVAMLLTLTPLTAAAFSLTNMGKAQDAIVDAEKYMAAAMQPQAQEQYRIAEGHLKQVVIDDPMNSEAHELLGRVYLALGKHSEARASFLSATITGISAGREFTGTILYVNPRELSKVQEVLERALRQNPKSAPKIIADLSMMVRNAISDGKLDLAKGLANMVIALDADKRLEMSAEFETFADRQSRADSLVYYRIAFDLLEERDGDQREAIGLKVLDASQKEKGSRADSLKVEAKRMLGADHPKYAEAYPPLTWKTVFHGEYIGKGMGPKEYVKTAKAGQDYKIGDKLVVRGEFFQAYYGSGWTEHKGELVDPVTHSGSGYFGVKAPQGVSFIVEVLRLM